MSINRNTTTILAALIEGGGNVSALDLCSSLAITRPVLLYHIKELNKELHAHRLPGVTLDGDQLAIAPWDRERIDAFMTSASQTDYVFLKEERHDLMLLLTALSPRPITKGCLSEFFSVSRSTVTSDIASFRERLIPRGIRISSQANKGYRPQGDEGTIRWLVMDAWYRLDSGTTSAMARDALDLSLLEHMGHSSLPSDAPPLTQLAALLQAAVLEMQEHTDEPLRYYLLDELAPHLAVIVLRSDAGTVAPCFDLALTDTPEWRIAASVLTRLNDLGLTVSNKEQPYIAALLRGERVFARDDPDNATDALALSVASSLITLFEQHMCTSIEARDDFSAKLLPHVRAMLVRAAFHLKIPTSITKFVTERHPALFEATALVASLMNGPLPLDLEDDEIAGLCVYFGSQNVTARHSGAPRETSRKRRILIVCAGGIGTSLMVKQQLTRILGTSYECSTCTLHDLPSDVTFDLIVSTVRIDAPTPPKPHTLLISPIISPQQERELLEWSVRTASNSPSTRELTSIIEQYVSGPDALRLLHDVNDYLVGGGAPQQHALHLLDILTANRIDLVDVPLSSAEAIRLGCAPLVRDGFATDAYADEILACIAEYGMYAECRPGILIAHARPGSTCLGTAMSLSIFRVPVSFGTWGSSIRVVFTLAAVDDDRHLPAMRELMTLLSSPETCEALRTWADNTPEALYLYLASRLQSNQVR